MVAQQTVCLRQLGAVRAGEVRFGRFLANKNVTMHELRSGVCAPTLARCAGRHVLAIQDTTEINYQNHARRVSELGTVGNGSDLGLFLHPVLTVDAEDGACLGLADLHIWQRLHGKSPDYKKQPIEEKESYRWLEAPQRARECLQSAAKVTVVADREADIYELWSRIPDPNTELLIRAGRDRNLVTHTDQKLFEWIAEQPIRGEYILSLPAIANKRTAHDALMHVRFEQVTIKKPQSCSDKKAPKQLTLNMIEVVEDPGTVVGKEKPIHWRLLTTHPVSTLAQALQCIEWYCSRWQIEQFFRTLKKQGLNVESSLVEKGERLEKLVVLAASAAVRSMQLTLAREGNTTRPASDTFTKEEQDFLDHLQPELEGKTDKQKNPHEKRTLAWSSWIIARLGGWKGYSSERKPGPITMLHGLQRFSSMQQGWLLARRLFQH